MPEVHDPYSALRHADYRRLLAGNMLASIGNQMQSVAVGWELYNRTNAATALGLVGLVQFLPVALLTLPAGHAADRHNRKALMISAQTLAACASLGLTVLSLMQGPIPLVYLCLLLVGIAQAFNSPARWALVAQVVPEQLLANAVTWNSSGWQTAAVVGPALGGSVIAVMNGAAGAYLGAALCSGTCVLLVLSIRPRAAARHREPLSLRSLAAGIGFVRRTKPILATITLDLFAVLFGGATALLPIFARDILNVDSVGLGWLRAAPSLGALCMALTMAHRPPLRHSGRAMVIAVAGFGLATIVFGLSRNFFLSFLMLAVTGALDNISVVVRGTLVQVLTPESMRGRVSAINALFISSSNQLGDFESGITAAWVGPVLSVVGGGIGTLLVVGAVMWAWPVVLRLGPLHRLGPDQTTEEIPISSSEAGG